MGLYQKYRPKSLKMLVGNESLKRDLRPFVLGKREPPKAVLFTGLSGAGKTTCARILARGIGCAENDIAELDTADFRGIDSIRDIRRQMMLSSLAGGNRCWILDECFAAGTLISAPKADVRIEMAREGDAVFSAAGLDTVKRVMRKVVPLKDLVLVHCRDGRRWATTRDHEFFTWNGWQPAKLLGGNNLLPFTPESPFRGLPDGFLRSRLLTETSMPEAMPAFSGRENPAFEAMHTVVRVERAPSLEDFRNPAFDRRGWEHVDIEHGCAVMYDLELAKHHSYYANGVLVHNCHKLTNDAQNALLKALESPPEHVYFILCTTDPQLLLKTILTRCTQFAVEALSTSELVELLRRVCEGERAEVDDDILKQVAKSAQGSPRAAISALERLLARDPKDYGEALATFASYETQIRDLCQALLAGKAKWKDVAGIIKGIKEEPETVRRSVLGYMNAVLLSGKDSARAAYILDCFKEPYFNTGPAGLTLSCYAGLMQE